MAKERVIHFTHHMCREQNLPRPEHVEAPRYQGRMPTANGCSYWYRATRWTTNPKLVTCRWCVAWRADETRAAWTQRAQAASQSADVRYWSNWRDDRTLVKEAWMTCCARAGASWPFGADELAACKREQRVRTIDVVPYRINTLAFSEPESRVLHLEVAAKLIREVDPDLLEALHPALTSCALAIELLAEVDKILGAALAHAETVRQTVLAGQLDDRRAIAALSMEAN